MQKAVEEYLKDCGCRVVRQSAEPAPITFESLVDGFLVHVLRLDSESYRRAFWREAYRNGHTIGHVPRTFESFFRRNARTFEQKVSLFLAVTALFGAYTVLAFLVRSLSLLIRRLRRPTYYEREPVPPAMLLPVPETANATPASVPTDAADGLRAGLVRAREIAQEILGECEGTFISLEAALALRLDSDCIPALGEDYVRKPGRPRIPRRVIDWLCHHRAS